MNRPLAAALALLVLCAPPGARAAGDHKKEKNTMEWKGSFCGVTQPSQVIVKTQQEWEALWKKIGDKPAPPADFTKYFGVGVFLGTKPTGGFGVVWKAYENAVVYSVKKPDGMVIQALTQPYAVKLFPRSQGEIQVGIEGN